MTTNFGIKHLHNNNIEAYIYTYLSLADIATLTADYVVDNGPVVEPVDQTAATGVHQGVLQSTEKNSVQLLHVMLISLLNTQGLRTNQ